MDVMKYQIITRCVHAPTNAERLAVWRYLIGEISRAGQLKQDKVAVSTEDRDLLGTPRSRDGKL
jgi:hypothetical protein